MHVISTGTPKPTLVMEVMPTMLAKRHFPPLDSASQLMPGYRDSPDPEGDMALVYIKVGPLLPHETMVTGHPRFKGRHASRMRQGWHPRFT